MAYARFKMVHCHECIYAITDTRHYFFLRHTRKAFNLSDKQYTYAIFGITKIEKNELNLIFMFSC